MLDMVGFTSFAVHGGGDSGGGPAGAVESILSFIESLLQLSPAQVGQALMPGLASLDNLHPLFVHFPIALLTLFYLFDLGGSLWSKSSWRHIAGWFLYSGTVFAGFTVAAGLLAAATIPHGGEVHEIMENHEHLGISVLSLASALAVWRWLAKQELSGAANTLYQLLASVLFVLLTFTADLGGLMVYRYGVAVKPVEALNQAAALRHQHGDSAMPATGETPPIAVEPVLQAPPPPPVAPDAHHHDHHGHNH
ncbi:MULTISPECIES: DUF2231 domain-containing protein [Methylomonas]|uniref:DUF2231 domain-containing protein n=1 Tax=Methylomonas TaxID=416 RepID=UPI001232396F|nr:DUF2231 domain-containing protein [Methylomonas rhizoryzae]